MTTLISGYLERISSTVFDDYHREITKLIGNQHGVYALYKKDRLYYVGLATNLRMRVKYHLKDRHAKKWDTFSLFLIHNAEHLKELESLLIRISQPTGNKTKGSLPSSGNLLKSLKKALQARNKTRLDSILQASSQKKKSRRTIQPAGKKSHLRLPAMKGLLPVGSELRATYKRREYVAYLDAEGRIELNGERYTSPSSAGSAITGKPIDGWHFWKYKNTESRWVKIDELRKRA